MSGSGKSGNNRKNRHRFSGRREDSSKSAKRAGESFFSEQKFERKRDNSHERLRWTAPVLPANPITTPDCSWCGKQIKDITSAISDKESGKPIHFDCVLARIAEMERLGTNDSVCYIGGGRFGIVHHNNPPNMKDFSVKKILEWENKEKDKDHEWRKPISEYFSIT